MTEALAVSYHYSFDDCKEKIAWDYPDLDLSCIIIIEEDAKEEKVQEEDAVKELLPRKLLLPLLKMLRPRKWLALPPKNFLRQL